MALLKRPDPTAEAVAALLRGGERGEVWWGGEGWGEETTHTECVAFVWNRRRRVLITLPLPAGATHQVRIWDSHQGGRFGLGLFTNRHAQDPKSPRTNPHEVGSYNVIVYHDPRLRTAQVRYE